MCGILGLVSGYGHKINVEVLNEPLSLLSHRGPDAKNIWVNNKNTTALGHTRLSIIDLSEKGSQPMMSQSNRYVIVFNGEIYNYIELRVMLEKQGIRFQSKSDTEILLALYELKKENCLQYIDGMFSFAIWDKDENKLFCARDRFGEKPFFYATDNKVFVFASEMKALWNYGIPRVVKPNLLYNYISDSYLFNPDQFNETFFAHIHRLEPAHYLILDSNLKITTKKYWGLDYLKKPQKYSEIEAIERLTELLTTSVSRRLRADTSIGTSLSGGLDSSIIAVIISKLLNYNKTYNTYSARFKDMTIDEGKYIQEIVNSDPSIKANEIYTDVDGFINDLDKLLYHQEEPIGSASVYCQFKVMELAKQKGTFVLLDGQGADEIFGGYPSFIKPYLQELYRTDKKEFHDQLKYFNNNNDYQNLKFVLQAKHPKMASQFGFVKKIIAQEPNKHYFNDDFRHSAYLYSKMKIRSHASLNFSLFESTTMGPLQELLRYSDRNSMAHSIETRMPFLSHELVEFAFSLSNNLKINNGNFKYILKKSFQNQLPKLIAERKDKIGFLAPQKQWMENPNVKEMVIESYKLLTKEKILSASSFDTFMKNYSFEKINWNILIAAKTLTNTSPAKISSF